MRKRHNLQLIHFPRDFDPFYDFASSLLSSGGSTPEFHIFHLTYHSAGHSIDGQNGKRPKKKVK